MGADDNGDLGFQEGGGSHLNCLSSGMYTATQPEKVAGVAMSSASLCKYSNGVDSFFSTGWDPLVSLAENVEFKSSSMASCHSITISPYSVGNLENHGNTSTSLLVQYPSDPSLSELASRLPCFGSGSFSEMVSSFGLPKCNQIANSGCPSDYHLTKEGSTRRNSTNSRDVADQGTIFQDDLQISDEGAGGLSPKGKKRKMVTELCSGINQYQFDSLQIAEVEQQNDLSQDTLDGWREQGEKKQKTEKNIGTNVHGKLSGKQAKDSSQNGQTSKEDYIHVRARRGQATNSHSLAERVRREKISQRMRYLQDIVPGCDKITGKALMLDEIINYVQSLQRQVEFLSMKLATVNPEMHIDIERVLSKDILHVRGGGSDILRFGPGMSSSHPHPHIIQQGAMRAVQCTDSQLPSMPQLPTAWDDELRSIIQMEFMSNPALGSLGSTGHMKVEL